MTRIRLESRNLLAAIVNCTEQSFTKIECYLTPENDCSCKLALKKGCTGWKLALVESWKQHSLATYLENYVPRQLQSAHSHSPHISNALFVPKLFYLAS